MTSLRAQAVAGAKWTTTSAVGCSLIQVIKMAVLARLVPREDFGLFATIGVIIGFAQFFVEAGLSNALIHKQETSKTDLASAYSINLFLGWLFFAIIFFLSIPVANFYGEPRLVNLIRLSSLIFLIQPPGKQYDALLRRDLQFNTLAKLDILSAFVGLVVAVGFSVNSFGVMALIFSHLTATIIRTLILLFVGIRAYGFNIGFSYKRAKFFLRFGFYQISESVINYSNTQIDTILIGKVLGQESLGLFYMAKQIAFRPIQVINPILTKISLPIFAKIQNDKTRLRKGFLEVVHSLAIVHFAIFSLISAFSQEISTIFLGHGWGEAAKLLHILAFYTMLRAIGNPVGSLLIATGRVALAFYWNLCLLFYTPVIVLASSKWGAIGIAWGLLFGMIGLQIPAWYFLIRKTCGASFTEYFGKLAKTLLIAAICFWYLPRINSLVAKFSLSIITTLTYLYIHISAFKRLAGMKKT